MRITKNSDGTYTIHDVSESLFPALNTFLYDYYDQHDRWGFPFAQMLALGRLTKAMEQAGLDRG